METERIFTISKMSLTDGDKSLWAIVDEFGHTMIQVWSEKEPIEVVSEFGGVIKTLVVGKKKVLA